MEKNLCYSLILSISITATLGIFSTWSFKITFLIGLYDSTQSLTIPCPQSKQSALLRTKHYVFLLL